MDWIVTKFKDGELNQERNVMQIVARQTRSWKIHLRSNWSNRRIINLLELCKIIGKTSFTKNIRY